ncbi:MAG: hypothetical protein KY461_16065, partial [Actinobacteria bacterium]|nr:hypothetical protein [Actinomycetota bacterium]
MFLAAVVLAALFAPAAVAGTGTQADPFMPGDSVTICHSGNGKKFVVNNPSVSSGGETTGHEGHSNDIFPPYWFKQNAGDTPTFFEGQNWTTYYAGETGETIHGNGCKRAGEPTTAPVATLDPCDADGFEFTLDNSGSTVDLTFVGTHANATQAFSNSVTTGQSEDQLVTIAEDAAYDITVTVTYESTVIYSQRFHGTRNCDPNATIAPVARLAPCDADGFEFTLDNSDSTVDLTFVGTHANATQAFSEEVPAGSMETVTVTVAEDAAYDITVTVTRDNVHVYSQRFNGTRDCQPTIIIVRDPDPEPDPVVTLVPGISIDKTADDDTYS